MGEERGSFYGIFITELQECEVMTLRRVVGRERVRVEVKRRRSNRRSWKVGKRLEGGVSTQAARAEQ